VFNTSFTTAAAFFATAVSPIMPIATFGIFSAVVILVNFVFVLTLTPAALMVNELSQSKGCTPCGCCCAEGCCCCAATCNRLLGGSSSSSSSSSSSGQRQQQQQQQQQEEGVEVEVVDVAVEEEGFFRTKLLPAYFDFMQSKARAGVVVGLLTVYMGLGCWWASQLEPPLATEDWLPAQHGLTKAFDLNDEFMVIKGGLETSGVGA
jgi:hypothetical protein